MTSHSIDAKLIRPVANINRDFCRHSSLESVGRMPALRTLSKKPGWVLMMSADVIGFYADDLTPNGGGGQAGLVGVFLR